MESEECSGGGSSEANSKNNTLPQTLEGFNISLGMLTVLGFF